jgi:acyl-CoA synthetase (AMP-forming)/AMP-acid ligase II
VQVDRYVEAVAREVPRACALVADGGRTLDYATLARRIDAAAHAFAAAGLGPGQRALLVGENTVEMVVALLGAIRTGAWAVPLNARMAAGEVDAIADHCAPRLAWCCAASADGAAHAERWQSHAADDALGRGRLALREGADTSPDGADDVALMLYTSGSTGRPKGVMLSHGNLDFVTRASMAQRVLVAGDRIFHALPLSHSFGLVSVLLCALRAGATLRLVTRFDAEALAHALLNDGITVFQGVPAMYARLSEWAARSGTVLQPNALRLAYIGGAQIDPARKAQAEALLGVPLHHGYGLTEAAPAATRTLGHPPPRDVTAGWPVPGVEVIVADAGGRPLPPGERGEVLVRGPNVMKGYFRDPAQTRAAIDADGWLHTGDLGVFGPEGDLAIVGRIKEMIIRGGFNVYPAEVESAIAAYPGVAQCAVLGRASGGDEEVVAFIEPQAGSAIDEQALARFLRSRLAPYKIPSRYRLMQRLPAAPTGKVLKARLVPLLDADAPAKDA